MLSFAPTAKSLEEIRDALKSNGVKAFKMQRTSKFFWYLKFEDCYGNFIGETVRMASEHGFPKVTLGIMIGKAVKLAAGHLDTHSKVVTVDKEFVRWVAQKYGCSILPDDFTLARELWGIFKGEDARKFFGGIVELCHSHCAPLLPDGELQVVLVEE